MWAPLLPTAAELKLSARSHARHSAYLVAGGVLVAVGAGFLTAAIWIALATAFNGLAAALIIAGTYLGMGLLLLGIAPRPIPLAPPAVRLRAAARKGQIYQPTGSFPPMAEAFLFGLAMAIQMKNKRP